MCDGFPIIVPVFLIVLLRTRIILVLFNLSFLLLDPRICWNLKKHNAMFWKTNTQTEDTLPVFGSPAHTLRTSRTTTGRDTPQGTATLDIGLREARLLTRDDVNIRHALGRQIDGPRVPRELLLQLLLALRRAAQPVDADVVEPAPVHLVDALLHEDWHIARRPLALDDRVQIDAEQVVTVERRRPLERDDGLLVDELQIEDALRLELERDLLVAAALQEDLQCQRAAEAQPVARVRVPAVHEEGKLPRHVQVDVELLVPVEVDGARSDHRPRLVDGVELEHAVQIPQHCLRRLEAVAAVQTHVHESVDAPLLDDERLHVLHVRVVQPEVVRSDLEGFPRPLHLPRRVWPPLLNVWCLQRRADVHLGVRRHAPGTRGTSLVTLLCRF